MADSSLQNVDHRNSETLSSIQPTSTPVTPVTSTSTFNFKSSLTRHISLSTDSRLGASLKQKLKDVKDASVNRTKSLSAGSRQNRHHRGLNAAEPRRIHASNVNVELPQGVNGNGTVVSGRIHTPRIAKRPSNMADIVVPQLLQQGTPMTKVSTKKQKTFVFWLDADQGQILWVSKKTKIIPIENVKELRTCADARYYREQFQLSQEYEDRWLTIVYILEGEYKTLHLIASTRDVFRMWDTTLRQLYEIRQALMSGLGNVEMREAVWEKQYWHGADEQGDQKLDFGEVERLCRRLNIYSSDTQLRQLFDQADTVKSGFLDFPSFQRFVKLLKARPELDQIYKKVCASTPSGQLDYNTFEHFVKNEQKSDVSQSDLQRIFLRYSSLAPDSRPSAVAPLTSVKTAVATPDTQKDQQSVEGVFWSLDGFTAYLMSADNSAFADQNSSIWHDMTKPISEYYISSSHNTYLVGHQLVGVSTVEGYIRALLHSCRSVELDIYDGESEPVVFHGKTFTSKVPVRDICRAIAKYAFVSSPYPVIISAEIHCSVGHQDVLVDIMREVFGDSLVCAPIDGHQKIEVLPSPEDLKGRILLKAKNLYVSEHEAIRDNDLTIDTESSTTSTEASESELVQEFRSEFRKVNRDFKYELQKAKESEPIKDLKEELQKVRMAFGRKVLRSKSPAPKSVTAAAIVATTATASLQAPSASSAPAKAKMSFALTGLLVYTVGVKCRGINKKEEYAPEHIFSLSENTANKILRQGMVDLIKHNRTHVVRIYPKGLRLNSSNYEPHRYWSAGAQLVAINWQTFDLGYMINHAMFQRNGRAGYVLKPLALRTPDKDLLSKRTKHFLEVTIISAQQLPRPKDSSGHEILDKPFGDPFVEVSIHVPDWTHSPFLPTDLAANVNTAGSPKLTPASSTTSTARTITLRTPAVRNNGFNPMWQETLCLPFDSVGDMYDLIFVRFAVRTQTKEDDDEPLAVYCTSLGSLKQGFRHLPLHDVQLSQYLFSTLFAHINIQDA